MEITNKPLNVNNVKFTFLRASTNPEVNKNRNFTVDGLNIILNELKIERISNTPSDSNRQNNHRRSTYNHGKI